MVYYPQNISTDLFWHDFPKQNKIPSETWTHPPTSIVNSDFWRKHYLQSPLVSIQYSDHIFSARLVSNSSSSLECVFHKVPLDSGESVSRHCIRLLQTTITNEFDRCLYDRCAFGTTNDVSNALLLQADSWGAFVCFPGRPGQLSKTV